MKVRSSARPAVALLTLKYSDAERSEYGVEALGAMSLQFPKAPLGWKSIDDAPAETDLCICIKDAFGFYPLPFPCRKQARGWVNAKLGVPIDAAPLGWREWKGHRGRTW